jgi:hypothetical protein
MAPGELKSLERINPGGDTKPKARFAPEVLVKFGWDHDAEVHALQFIHGRLSVPMPRMSHHASFPTKPVVGPWNCVSHGVSYCMSSWTNAVACLSIL